VRDPLFLTGAGFLSIGGTLFVLLTKDILGQPTSTMTDRIAVATLLILPLLGAGLAVWPIRSVLRRVRALREGAIAVGELVSLEWDRYTKRDEEHPWLLRFEFTTSFGHRQAGELSTWNRNVTRRSEGERVWVVYDPDRPSICSIWPPDPEF
jgi:hypothetical protein